MKRGKAPSSSTDNSSAARAPAGFRARASQATPHTCGKGTELGHLRTPSEAACSGGWAAKPGGRAPRPIPRHPLRALRARPRGARRPPSRLRTAALPAASHSPFPSPKPVAALRLRCARSRAAAAMLNPYGATSWGDRVDDSGIDSRGCGEAATLGCFGSVEKGLGHAAPLAPCTTPENLRKDRPPGMVGSGGVAGTSAGKGGAGGYAPSPNATSVSGGGDTPDYILPPHQAKGNSGAPLEGSGIQFTANGSGEGASRRGPLEWGRGMANLCLLTNWRAKGRGGGVSPRFHSPLGGTGAWSQVLHCGGRLNPENNHRRRPVATPRRAEPGYAHAAPLQSCGLANGGATNGTTCPSLAVASGTGLGRLERLCWKGRQGEGAAPLPTSLFPWSCRTTAQPIGSEMWRVAASLGVYAALFCLVTDALEMRFMTSSLPPTNRKRSRGEVFLPLRLCFFTRVSERARAEGVGEIASTVARMSGEAPPPCLYIKGWRGAQRRHFALEWSSL
uniref:Uncharacterized protein n=1 Tax=Rangifer tarandus platyrhynchus TaxID=3082113 RepID=A0ACB0EXU1_RANTA|nr:unnamed protein product [Rangifer tarandus platyrhynchus]